MRRTPLVLAAIAAVAASVPGFSRQAPVAAPQGLTLPAPTFPAAVKAINEPRQALVTLDREIAARGEAAPLEAHVLRARLLSAAGRFQESVAAWDDVARRDEAMAPFAQRTAIAVLLAARDLEPARSRISALQSRPSDIARPALSPAEGDLLWLSLAEAYQSSKQLEQAAAIFREVAARQRGSAAADRARLGLAACEEAAGHLDAALALWHDATLTWRGADTYGTARTAERRVAAQLQREPPPFSEAQYFEVAERLVARSHFDDAVTVLEEGKRRGLVANEERLEAAVIDTLYRGRRNDEAMSRANQFLARFATSDDAPAVRLTQLRLDVRTGNLASARKRLSALNAAPPAPADVRQSAALLVAAQLVATGNAREGLALYRRLIAATRVRADRFDLSWRAGIAAMRGRDYRAALALFGQARRYAPARALPRSTVYWQAAALAATGTAAQARRQWSELVDDNAYDYYGLRAAQRLQRAAASTADPGAIPFPDLALSEAAQSAPDLRAAMTLARAGLDEDAASLLRRLAGRLTGDRALGLLAARAAYGAEDYATAASLVATRFSPFLAHPASGVPGDLWQMAFPRAYWSEVSGAAAKAGVDPLLLLSLMRRESRFVVAARSRTGALGLFQIMPYT
ncbi:MAG: transglycosylase SLT domain-containing protein, partial [Bacteroidales bacterium]